MFDQMASFENAVQLICLPQKMELHSKVMRPIEAKEFETFKQQLPKTVSLEQFHFKPHHNIRATSSKYCVLKKKQPK